MEDLGISRLRSFIAVADNSSVSEAAVQVGRTQSAVSLQMRNLEALTGAPLFRRLRHGVQLTPRGEELLAHARVILKAHDRALAEMSGQPAVGKIRLGCPEDYAQLLPAVLRDFAVEHPLTQTELECAPTPELQRMLDAGALDLSVLTLRRAKKSQLLRREQLVWVGRADMEKTEHPVIPLALSHAESVDRLAALDSLKRARRPYNVVCSSGSLAGIAVALDAGIAVAVLARSIVPTRFRILSDGWPELPKVDVAVVHGTSHPTSIAKKLASRLNLEASRLR